MNNLEENQLKEKAISMMSRDELIELIDQDLDYVHCNRYSIIKRRLGDKTLSDLLTDRGVEAYIRLLELELSHVTKERIKIDNSSTLGQYLANVDSPLDHEEMHVVCFNTIGQIISDDRISKGSLTRATVYPASIFRKVFANNAQSFVVCHNHPSGNLKPSNSDLELTKAIKAGAKIFKVSFLDHFILGEGEYLSMAEKGLI